MKRDLRLLKVLLVFSMVIWVGHTEGQIFLKGKIKKIPGVVSVEKMPEKGLFQRQYTIMFEQPIDHEDSTSGVFLQRLFLFHKGFSSPVVFTTEGYSADYALKPTYSNEIASKYDAVQIVAEHRYFGGSVPENAGWDPLTVENSAADHHRIVTAFKSAYHGKWVSTGISKGGTTALIHRYLYPDDVDATVAYVAPLNYGVEDGRHESFVSTNATHQYRSEIQRFQTQVLLRRDSMERLLLAYNQAAQLNFRIPLHELLDYLVLEYAFAFYQWGWDANLIPADGDTYEQIFLHLINVSPPEYFSVESGSGFLPFYVQASRQLGYYGYEIRPFYDLMKIQSTRGYLSSVMMPDSLYFNFDPSLSYQIQDYLFEADPSLIFIYGEWDPWSASAIIFDARQKKNMLKMVETGGCHLARIATLTEVQQQLVWQKLDEWLSR